MSYIPYCRASQALSIGIWFNLSSGKIWRKKLPIWIRYDTWFHPKRPNSNLMISSSKRCLTISNVWFDAQLNGLQNGIKFFLAIDFRPRYLVKILKKTWNCICKKKHCFWFLPSMSRMRRNVLYTIL
jgi:hypothetical protein